MDGKTAQSPLASPITPATSSTATNIASGAIIPDAHPARTLVLCFDGTGDQFDADNSNIVQLFSMLKKDDRTQQMVYYQAGIGTYTSPQVATPLMAKLSKTLDEMVAWNLDAHVMDGYEFLMQNYEAGDKICLFGFSRGAYTARALAGMIHKVGLLPACNHQQVPFAYRMFTDTSETGWAQSTAFKKAFSIDVDIEFIGVFDTVCSVGIIPHTLPFVTSNTAVKTFRHAVSLDERRAKFKANLFNRPTKKEQQLGTKEGDMPKAGADPSLQEAIAHQMEEAAAKAHAAHPHKKRPGNKQRELERQFSMAETSSLETDVLEVWFAGCHCDIGGGSVPNDTRHSLARIPLRWMIRQCFLTNTGIRFHAELLKTVGLDPESLWPVVKERPEMITTSPRVPPPATLSSTIKSSHTRESTQTLINYANEGASTSAPSIGYSGAADLGMLTEEEEDLADALSPIYDQLSLKWGWWLLEVLPLKHKVQREDDDLWINDYYLNLGRGRKIPKQKRRGFYVHRTVKLRREAEGLEGGKYEPKAHFKVDPTWVD